MEEPFTDFTALVLVLTPVALGAGLICLLCGLAEGYRASETRGQGEGPVTASWHWKLCGGILLLGVGLFGGLELFGLFVPTC